MEDDRRAAGQPVARRPSTALAPAAEHDLRPHLPGVEPDRRLTDWGRSERLEGLFDRTLADFLFHLWFRCDVEGIENVPSVGGALLVSNQAGALPPGAAMVAKAIREEHARARALHIAVEDLLRSYPGMSMLLPKLGCVAAHPANLHRLLHDEGSLVLAFPEGRAAARKAFRDRYRLRPFGSGAFVASAVQAAAPIVPVCVVGAEEAAPVFARLRLVERLTGLSSLPLTPTFPHLGPFGLAAYLPAKFRIRFLEPVEVEADPDDRGALQTSAEAIRAGMQESLLEMVGARDSVWTG